MWTKIGDEFVDDAADLSDAAVRTHLEALAWSNRRLLDLVIPKRDLRRFAFSETADAAVTELVNVGWWEDCGNCWALVYRPEWQQSREQVEKRREDNLRSQWHRRGKHDLCVVGKCAALSADDTRADARADTDDDDGADPGRVGSVSGQALEDGTTAQPVLTTVPEPDSYGLANCVECGDRAKLDALGTCSDFCAAAVAAVARVGVAS